MKADRDRSKMKTALSLGSFLEATILFVSLKVVGSRKDLKKEE